MAQIPRRLSLGTLHSFSSRSRNYCNIVAGFPYAFYRPLKPDIHLTCKGVPLKNRFLTICSELRHHAPFTVVGAVTGIVCMLGLKGWGAPVNHQLFLFFHPLHVLLSAIVTASLFKMRAAKSSFLTVALVGYCGAIGVATLSDCVVPYLGESFMGIAVPAHAGLHDPHTNAEAIDDSHAGHDHQDDQGHAHPVSPEAALRAGHHEGPDIHLGFIEDWYVVNPAALLGILLAYLIPHERLHTRLPHAAHVLVSTWASSFHMLMNTHVDFTPMMFVGAFLVLFVAVWLPCCISDIVFPILFVGEGKVPSCCALHRREEEA